MFRLWITSALVGTLASWYYGLDPFEAYLYEWIILGTLVFGAGFLILIAGTIGSPTLVLIVVGALPLAMAYSEHKLTRGIKPSNAFHRYGEAAPVGLETWIDGTRVLGRITNRHARDWLRLAMVRCTPVYANGKPSQRVREISIGAGGWLAPGEGVEQPLLDSSGILWEPGLSLMLTRCAVNSADFYADPEQKPAFTFTMNRDNHYVFEVTNTQRNASLTRVSFSCWVLNLSAGSKPHKQDLRVRPLYQDDTSYVVRAGESITLYNTEFFAGRSLTSCTIKDIRWAK